MAKDLPVSPPMLNQRSELLAIRQRLVATVLAGDAIVIYLALCFAFFVRFGGPMEWIGFNLEAGWPFRAYQGVILLGVATLVAFCARRELYNWKLFLRPRQLTQRTIQAVTYWFIVYLAVSIVFRFEPTVSRLFMAFSWALAIVMLVAWRYTLCHWIRRRGLFRRLSQRVIFVGWNPEAATMARNIESFDYHPYQVEGWLTTPGSEAIGETAQQIGDLANLEAVLTDKKPDILLVADLNLGREELAQIVKLCEIHYIQLKILPTMFQVFVSGLRLETISELPLLGVGELPIQRLGNRAIKRGIDIVGASIGLALSLPIMLVLAWRIRQEDPGAILFIQERIGRNHRPFRMLKLRSMKQGAEQTDHQNQSTLRDDPRLLKVGVLMRQWNLDELPQFWNVLKGEMSLVGPRPERTHFVGQLSSEVNFYNNRHYVKPGMTGWAQINGLRGDTDLSKRIRHDIYYIENWSLWMDFFCLIMTFFSRKNAY